MNSDRVNGPVNHVDAGHTDSHGAPLAVAIERLAVNTRGPIRMAHPDVAMHTPEQLPQLCAQVAQGRRMRGLYELQTVHSRSLEINRWATTGEEQRLAANIPTEFMCFGAQAALISSTWGEYGDFVIIESPSAIGSLTSLFERMWETSVSVEGNVDARSGELVDLLHRGYTDDEIARELGISLRSVRKRINALMQECGVNTRFTLALALAERGMLEPTTVQPDSGWPSR